MNDHFYGLSRFVVINDLNHTHKVEFVNREQEVTDFTYNVFGPGFAKGESIEAKQGTGATRRVNDVTSLIVIVKDSKLIPTDYHNLNTGKSVPGILSQLDIVGETFSHELGHGIGIFHPVNFPFKENFNGDKDALQMGNLYLRSRGYNLYRDGTNHGNEFEQNPDLRRQIPFSPESSRNIPLWLEHQIMKLHGAKFMQ